MTETAMPDPDDVRGAQLYGLGARLYREGDLPAAVEAIEQARQCLSGDPSAAAACDVLLARVSLDQEDTEAAERLVTNLPRSLDDQSNGWALYVRARLQLRTDPLRAAELIQQAIARYDDRTFAAACLLEWAHAAQAFGRLGEAVQAYREVGDFYTGNGDVMHASIAVYGEAQTLILQAQQLEQGSDEEVDLTTQAFERNAIALAGLQSQARSLPDHRSREQWRRSVDSVFVQALRIAADGLKDATRVAELVERAVVAGVYVVRGSTATAPVVSAAAAPGHLYIPAALGATGVAVETPPPLGWAPNDDGTVRLLVTDGPTSDQPWIPTW